MHPAKNKSPGRPEAAPQICVLATGFWNRRAQLRKRKRPEHREDGANNPCGENDGYKAPLPRHSRGLQENSGPDHGTYDNRRRSPRPKLTHQLESLAFGVYAHPFPSTAAESCIVVLRAARLTAAPTKNVMLAPTRT